LGARTRWQPAFSAKGKGRSAKRYFFALRSLLFAEQQRLAAEFVVSSLK
jgi:hypothetical protein